MLLEEEEDLLNVLLIEGARHQLRAVMRAGRVLRLHTNEIVSKAEHRRHVRWNRRLIR